MILRLKERFSQLRFVPNPVCRDFRPCSCRNCQASPSYRCQEWWWLPRESHRHDADQSYPYCWKVAFSHSFAAECLVFTTNEPFELLDRDLADQCLGKKTDLFRRLRHVLRSLAKDFSYALCVARVLPDLRRERLRPIRENQFDLGIESYQHQ